MMTPPRDAHAQSHMHTQTLVSTNGSDATLRIGIRPGVPATSVVFFSSLFSPFAQNMSELLCSSGSSLIALADH